MNSAVSDVTVACITIDFISTVSVLAWIRSTFINVWNKKVWWTRVISNILKSYGLMCITLIGYIYYQYFRFQRILVIILINDDVRC